MHALWQWLTKDSNHDLLVAIVGAVVGGMIGIVASGIAVVGSYWLTARSDRKKDRETLRHLLTSLLAEINHIISVADEILPVAENTRGYCTKRMNSDVLESARISLARYEDMEFILALTTAYREIVHTNAMLDRLEDKSPDFAQRETIRPGVVGSIKVVQKSARELKAIVEKKLEDFTD